MSILYLDMDGVLANFEKWAIDNIGICWKEEIEKDKWGKLFNYPNLYIELPPMDYAKELYDVCCDITKNRDSVQLLTAIPSRVRFKDCAKHKIEWARKFIHPNIKVNFGPYAEDKQYHYRTSDILVDDAERNIEQWKGIGILHVSFENTVRSLLKIGG